jgi:16S rRNA (guanine966-N2)-methyltransferase
MQKKPGNKTAAKPSDRNRHAARNHQVRIIGGLWKRTPLTVLEAEGLRPTPDRVRETVFNWLNHLLDGAWQNVSCLDLFAGTGVLGFEAASRGAKRVLMVEANTRAVRQLEAAKDKLHADQVNIVRGDAFSNVQSLVARRGDIRLSDARFEVIFLDPPYHQEWLAKMVPLCGQLLAEGGVLYVESEQALDGETPPDWLAGWEVVRADKAGMVFYHLLQRNYNEISGLEIQA